MESTHETSLLHNKMRWLSGGKALTRFYDLREEFFFLSEHPSKLSSKSKEGKNFIPF